MKPQYDDSMVLFRTDVPKPEELMNWAGNDLTDKQIDLVLEFLRDSNLLNRKGKKFAHDFWEVYIHDKDIKKYQVAVR